MRTLGWNCRGLGNPRSVRLLRNIVQQWDPDFVFLSETKLREWSMERKKMSIGFTNGLVIPSHGRSVGWLCCGERKLMLMFKASPIDILMP